MDTFERLAAALEIYQQNRFETALTQFTDALATHRSRTGSGLSMIRRTSMTHDHAHAGVRYIFIYAYHDNIFIANVVACVV